MPSSRVSTWATPTVVSLLAAGLTGFAPADSPGTNAADAIAAIQQAAPEVVAGLAETAAGGREAAVATVAGETVTVPTDPSDGISLGAITVGLPYSQQAGDAVVSAGVVTYDNDNGSTTVPVIHRDGAVQISTVIDTPAAPRRYAYPMTLGAGQVLRIDVDGSAKVVDQQGSLILAIASPWAKDAAGDDVPTHYEVDGATLVQVVDFSPRTAFPVVADPTYRLYTIHYSRSDVEQMWKMMNNINNVCHYVPLPYLGALSCGAPANLAAAISQAHYQARKIDAVYYDCGYNYCSYYSYSVV